MANDDDDFEDDDDGANIFCVIVIEDEIDVDPWEASGKIDEYWAAGWVSDFCFFNRSNSAFYNDRYYKVFPTRYRLKDFVFTKSLRRVLKKNRDLKTVIRPLRITPEKCRLYDYYNCLRHGEPPRKSLLEAYDYIVYYPSKLMELCIFKENRLVACSIFEVGNRAMYSRNAFWELSEASRGLGILTILLEVEYARRCGLKLYYLGFYYRQDPNYQYKARFGGLEIYDWDNKRWIDFQNPEVKGILRQRLPSDTD